jgi:hypothetical protein
MSHPVRWHKIVSDHCAPDDPRAVATWAEHGHRLGGMTTTEVQSHLSPWGDRESCPIRVARFVRWCVANVGAAPPDGWPRGYAKPGALCPDPDAEEPPRLAQVEATHQAGKVERKQDENAGTMEINAKGQGLVRNLDDLLVQSQTDTDDWRVIDHKVNTWTTPLKGSDGTPKIVRNWQVSARLERRLIAPGEIGVTAAAPMPREAPAEAVADRTALLIPDSQHGFRWSPDRRRLIPMHDRAACDAVLRVAALAQPDEIVLLGDMLDLAEWSTKYPRPMDLRDTTQATLHALHWFIATLRATVPSARIVYLEGNHEARITRMLTERAAHVATLTAVGDSRPALSVPRLLDLDALGVEYVEPYGETFYLSPRVALTHGNKVRSGGGATTQAVIKEARVSTGFGHIHRVSIAHRTVYDHTGRRTITAATPGCLCDLDQTPAAGADLDWQHGYGIVRYGADYDDWSVHTISGGRTFYGDRPVYGDPEWYGAQVVEATGLDALG